MCGAQKVTMRDVCFRASGQQNLRDLIQANVTDGWVGMVTWLKNNHVGDVADQFIPKFVAKQVDKFEGKCWRCYVIGEQSAITGVPIEGVPETELRQHGNVPKLQVYTLDPATAPPLPTPLSSFHYIRHGTAVYRPMDNWDVFLTEETKETVQTLCPIFVAVLRLCIQPNSHIFLQTKRLRDLETKLTPQQKDVNWKELKSELGDKYAAYVKSPENKQFHAIIFRDALRQLTDVRNTVSPPNRKFIEEWKAYHTPPQLDWTCALSRTDMLQKQHEWLTGAEAKTLYGDSPQIIYLKEVIQLQITINHVNSFVDAIVTRKSPPTEINGEVFRTLKSIVTSPGRWTEVLEPSVETMDFYGATWVRSQEAETRTSDELEEFHVFDAVDVLCDVGWEKDSENEYLYVIKAKQLIHALPLGPNLVISGPEGNEQHRYLLPSTPSFTDEPERYPYAYAVALRRLHKNVVNTNANAAALLSEDKKASANKRELHRTTPPKVKTPNTLRRLKVNTPKTQKRSRTLKVVHVTPRRRRRWKQTQTQPIPFVDTGPVRGRTRFRENTPRPSKRSRTPSYVRVDEFKAKIEAVLFDIIPSGILSFDDDHPQDSGNAPTLYVYGSATYSHDANDLDVFYRCNTPIKDMVVSTLRHELKPGSNNTFVFKWEDGFTIDFHVVTTETDVEKMKHVLHINNFIRERMRNPYTLKFYEDSKVWCRAHGMYNSKLLLWRGVALALFSISRMPTKDTVVDDEMRKFLYARKRIAFANNGDMTESPIPNECQSVSVVTFDGKSIFHTTPNILRGMWRSLSTRFFDTMDRNLHVVPTVVNYESDYRYSALVDLLTSQFVCAKPIDLLPYVAPDGRVGFRVWAEEGEDATAAVDSHVTLFTTALSTEGFSRGR